MQGGIVLRDEQRRAVDGARKFLAARKAPSTRMLFASATGTGKSYVEHEIRESVVGSVLLTPSNDIIYSLLSKIIKSGSIPSTEGKLRRVAAEHRIYTPLTFRNALLAGEIEPPSSIIWDEVHHHNASTWGDVSSLCDSREVGFTATPYRGTPKGTVEFRERWGNPLWIYTYPDAIDKGYICLPSFTTVPLLDDDVIDVVAGEFQVASIESETRSRLLELATLIKSYPLDRPTMVALPTRALCEELRATLPRAVVVTGDSSREERREAYSKCLGCKAILIQVKVVGEGVDLAIRRLFDAMPTLSPVWWVQLVGRVMRPLGKRDKPPEVIVTNRNLLRHVYALQGVVPVAELSRSQELLGFGTRSGSRAFGLEGLGRFKANPLPLANGLKGEVYMIENRVDGSTVQYAAVLHPLYESPLWATRTNGQGTYGRWSSCKAPDGFKGFTSGKGSEPSPKQKAWWMKAASKYGLDKEATVNRRTFAALPILADLGVKMEV